MNRPDLMVFEPNLGGHHAEFTCHVLRHWLGNVPEASLVAAVAPGLLEQQPGLSAGAIDPPRTYRVTLDGRLPGDSRGLWGKGRSNLLLLKAAIERHQPRHVLVMYLDQVQLALAAGLRFPFPVRISGILFHPTLHYRPAGRFSPRDYVQRLRKRLFLRLIAQNPHLDTVFTLDPTAVPSLRKLGLDAVALPDPVIQTAGDGRTREEMRLLHGIEPGRRVLLLFGALTARKGVLQVLEAVRLLPPQAARSIALFLAGPLDPELRPRVTDLVALARGRGVQVVRHDAYIQNGSVQAFIGAADLVLAPYQRHFGSSAVLIRAALAERPVLSQEFGLMGAYVRQHGLGQAVDSGSPAAIAAGIEAFLLDPSAGFDPARSRQFVLANTPERFCETLLSRVHRARVPEPLLTHPL